MSGVTIIRSSQLPPHIFLGEFNNREDVQNKFDIQLVNDVVILLAWYSYVSYDGRAFVLFAQGGQLYEVNASHCSCYGLEGQWEPEETSLQHLRYQLEQGVFSSDHMEYREANQALSRLVSRLTDIENDNNKRTR
jgi:hypothetical protein